MSCTRVIDYIRGLEIRLAVPPCQTMSLERGGDEPRWSLLHPGEEALALMRRHERMLMEMTRPG